MANAAPKDAPSKFARYRANKRNQGMKLIRLWVPDPSAPGFREEAARQAALINAAPDSQEIMDFIEAMTAELDLEPYDWGPAGPPAIDDDADNANAP
jgi:hypothetical protein